VDDEMRPGIADVQASAQRSFDSAVIAERAAIRIHWQAATLHRERATRLGRLAEGDVTALRRTSLLRQAEIEEGRADAATGRASFASQRLIDEGVTP
jgi:hypothetical protein